MKFAQLILAATLLATPFAHGAAQSDEAKRQILYETEVVLDGVIISRAKLMVMDGESASMSQGDRKSPTRADASGADEHYHFEVRPKIQADGRIASEYTLRINRDGLKFDEKFKAVSLDGEPAGIAEVSNSHTLRVEIRATLQ